MSSSSRVVPITPDVFVCNEGTIFLFCPLTSQAKDWIDEHVQSDALWFGTALVVEHRYACGLAQGMKDAGLALAWKSFDTDTLRGPKAYRSSIDSPNKRSK